MNRTKCEVELLLDEFALEEVERVAGRLELPRARIVECAVRHWLDEDASGRLATRPSSYPTPVFAYPPVPLAVDLPPSDWEAVKSAAAEERIPPERLVGHAVVLLLADVDAGRLAAHVARG